MIAHEHVLEEIAGDIADERDFPTRGIRSLAMAL